MWSGTRLAWVLLFGLLVVVHGVDAGGSVDVGGAATVMVRDTRGEDCDVALPLCLVDASHDGGGPANLTVGSDMRLSYVGVGVGGGWIPLLPDESLRVRGSEIMLPNPVVPVVSEKVGRRETPTPVQGLASIDMGERNVSATYYGPSTKSQDPVLAERYWALAYNNSVVGYRQFGPYNVITGNDTDSSIFGFSSLVCRYATSEPCEPVMGDAGRAIVANAPSVEWGLEVHETEVATRELSPDRGDFVTSARHPIRIIAGVPSNSSADPDPRGVAPGSPVLSHRAAPGGGAASPPPAHPGVDLVTAKVSSDQIADGPAGRAPLAAILATGVAWALMRGYARFRTPAEALASPPRLAVLDLIRKRPGVRLSVLTRELPLTRTAVDHHIRTLERIGLVKVIRSHRNVLLFTSDDAPREEPAVLTFLTHPVCNQLLRFVRDHPSGVLRARLHESFAAVPERSRNHSIRRLVQAGLIREEARPEGPHLLVAA